MKKYDKSIFMMDAEELYNFFADLDVVYDKMSRIYRVMHGNYDYKCMRFSLLELYSTCNQLFIEDIVFNEIRIYYDMLDVYRIVRDKKLSFKILKLAFDNRIDTVSSYRNTRGYRADEKVDYFVNIFAKIQEL